MTYRIKGDLNVSNVISVNGKYVANHSGDNVPDSTGDLKVSPGEVYFDGNINDIIIFQGTAMATSPIMNEARIVYSADELNDEKAFSTVGKVYDISSYTTWEYTGSWVSTAGIVLSLGLMYINPRTTKLYYVDPDVNKVQFIGTQTIGNRYAEVPDMKFFDHNLSDNGYQILPSGLKIQWVKVDTVLGEANITFPTPFTSVVMGGFGVDTKSNAWNNTGCVEVSVDMNSTTLTTSRIYTQTIWTNAGLKVNKSTAINDTTVTVMFWGF